VKLVAGFAASVASMLYGAWLILRDGYPNDRRPW
jgi:hypothetical protein